MAKKAASKKKPASPPAQPAKLPVHTDAWSLARLVAVLRGKADVVLPRTVEVNLNPHQGSHPVEILNALTLVLQCDLLLSDETSVEVCRLIASNQDPSAFYRSTNSDGAEREAKSSTFKKAVIVRNGQRVIKLDDIAKLVLPNKKWDETRGALWQRFFDERLQDNKANWGIRDDGYIDAFMATDAAADFRSFTETDRAAMTRTNRQRGAKKARQKQRAKKSTKARR